MSQLSTKIRGIEGQCQCLFHVGAEAPERVLEQSVQERGGQVVMSLFKNTEHLNTIQHALMLLNLQSCYLIIIQRVMYWRLAAKGCAVNLTPLTSRGALVTGVRGCSLQCPFQRAHLPCCLSPDLSLSQNRPSRTVCTGAMTRIGGESSGVLLVKAVQ